MRLRRVAFQVMRVAMWIFGVLAGLGCVAELVGFAVALWVHEPGHWSDNVWQKIGMTGPFVVFLFLALTLLAWLAKDELED